jgi:hypothetical protein
VCRDSGSSLSWASSPLLKIEQHKLVLNKNLGLSVGFEGEVGLPPCRARSQVSVRPSICYSMEAESRGGG